MKRNLIVLLSILLLTAPAGSSLAQGRWNTTAALSQEAKAALLTALAGPDGEYAARAEYEAILDKFGSLVLPYAHLMKAEERHVQALEQQCRRFGVPIPEDNYLGKIQAPESLANAAKAGILAEEANVKMYDELLKSVQLYPSLVQVFSRLRTASAERHLTALQLAEANGGSVTADICNPAGCMGAQRGGWGQGSDATCPRLGGQGLGLGAGRRQHRGGRPQP